MHHLILLTVWLATVAITAQCLDVSFIPNDENAPLPLSQKYRDSLRRLCTIMSGESAKIPPELIEKKEVLNKMCQKLAKDDANANTSSFNLGQFVGKWDMKSLVISLLCVGGGYSVWMNRRSIGVMLQSLFKAKGNPIPVRDVDHGGGGGGINIVNGNIVKGNVPAARKDNEVDQAAKRLMEAREARLKRFAEMNQPSNPAPQ